MAAPAERARVLRAPRPLLRRALAAVLIAVVTCVTVTGTAPSTAALPDRICFPVAARVSVAETFGAPRSGGRTHAGNDIFAAKHTPVVATVDGVVDWVKEDSSGLSGLAVGIRGADGWRYRYIHLNNDNPGTDDGAAPVSMGIAPGLARGQLVLAGQILGWVGDSGNAETTPPHLHFEIRTPDNVAVTPHPALVAADRGCPRPEVAGVASSRGGGRWVLTTTGRVVAHGDAPWLGQPDLGGQPLARAIAAMPDGQGYVVLDGWGGLHRFGSAQALPVPDAWWPGVDLARDVEVAPGGDGLAVLDGWGGVHAAGSLATVAERAGAYWPGFDIARDLELAPDGRGWFVLDGWGGLHASGSARVLLPVVAQRYWPGWDIARDLELSPDGRSSLLLDGLGGLHAGGNARAGALPYGGPYGWTDLDLTPAGWVAGRIDGMTVKDR